MDNPQTFVSTADHLRRSLDRMARHFSPDEKIRHFLIERTISVIANDPDVLSDLPIDQAMLKIMLGVFRSEFIRDEPEPSTLILVEDTVV